MVKDLESNVTTIQEILLIRRHRVKQSETRPYTRAEVACGWAGAAKKAKRDRSAKNGEKKLRVTDRRTDIAGCRVA